MPYCRCRCRSQALSKPSCSPSSMISSVDSCPGRGRRRRTGRWSGTPAVAAVSTRPARPCSSLTRVRCDHPRRRPDTRRPDARAGTLTSRVDDVLTLTFNRPERRNALSDELWSALRDAVRDVADDRTARAVDRGRRCVLLRRRPRGRGRHAAPAGPDADGRRHRARPARAAGAHGGEGDRRRGRGRLEPGAVLRPGGGDAGGAVLADLRPARAVAGLGRLVAAAAARRTCSRPSDSPCSRR